MSRQDCPKYFRQRYIVSLLAAAGGVLGKMDFQKLLFLSHQKTDSQYFDFVPYHYGCYSFQAASDLEVLEKNGWIQVKGNRISLLRSLPVEKSLKKRENNELTLFMQDHSQYRERTLVRHIYEHYPYYAIRSKMAGDVVDKKAFQRIQKVKSDLRQDKVILFTIGYEGISFENYVNSLITNDIRLLCDVRKNPLSRKFGFSKRSLAILLPKLGTRYLHIPDLGILSQNRKNLHSSADYKQLFREYQKTLPKKKQYLLQLHDVLRDKKRIALTCFEKNPSFCHRHCVSDWLVKETGIEVCHL